MKAAPPSVHSGIFTMEVVSSEPVCDEHYRLVLRAYGFPEALPGQFIQIRCGAADSDIVAGPSTTVAGSDEQCFGAEVVAAHGRGRPFTRRPFSIADVRRDGDKAEVDVLYRVIGPGTAWMAGLQSGRYVNVIGPLGRPFSPAAGSDLSILVGGGIGLPPVMWLGQVLAREGQKAVGVCGARSRNLLPITIDEGGMDDAAAKTSGSSAREPGFVAVTEFGNTPVVVTTDDGSFGVKGTVVDGLKAVLAWAGAAHSGAVVYACGPEKMLRAVAELALSRGVACQVCMERMMACGMGTCQSCVIRIRDASVAGEWRYRLCCTDGPVFDAKEVLW